MTYIPTPRWFSCFLQGRITFAATSSCHTVAPATLQLQVFPAFFILLLYPALLYDDESSLYFAFTTTRHNFLTAAQGVHEVLKSAGKDVYTLRFATEQLAQDWCRAFELIAKVSDFVALFVLFCFVDFFGCDFMHVCSIRWL